MLVITCCQNCASRYILSFLKSQSIECIACTSASGAAGRLAAPVGCIRTSGALPAPAPTDHITPERTPRQIQTSNATFSKLPVSKKQIDLFFWIPNFSIACSLCLFEVLALFKPVTEKRKVLKGEVFSIDSYCGNSRQSATRRVRVETNLVMQGSDAQRDSLEGKRKLTGSRNGAAFVRCLYSIYRNDWHLRS